MQIWKYRNFSSIIAKKCKETGEFSYCVFNNQMSQKKHKSNFFIHIYNELNLTLLYLVGDPIQSNYVDCC